MMRMRIYWLRFSPRTVGHRRGMGNEIAIQVANRLRVLREGRGFSVRELARRSGVRPESILRSERGDTEITITSLAKLCTALAVDLPSFFEFTKASPAPDLRAPELRRAVETLAALPPARRQEAVRGMELLLGVRSPAVALIAAEEHVPYSAKRQRRSRPASSKEK